MVKEPRTFWRYTAHVTANGNSETVVVYANRLVPDGHTLWFYDGQRLVGSLAAADVEGLFRDADDRFDDAAILTPIKKAS